MKRTHSLFQQYTAYVLLVSLCLQSCSGLNNPSLKEIEPSHKAPAFKGPICIEPLIDQTLTAQGGHAVTFCHEAGELKANVEMNVPEGFSKTYENLNVIIEQGAELTTLPRLDKQAQKGRICLQPAKVGKSAHVVIYKGAGLMGGMEGDDEEEPTYEEWIAQKRQPRNINEETEVEEKEHAKKGKEKIQCDLSELSLEERVTVLFTEIDTLIEGYLINNKQEKYKEQLIKKKLQEIRESFDELEAEESEQLGYFRYLYHIKNSAYLEALGKEKEAATQEKLSQRFKKFVKEKETAAKANLAEEASKLKKPSKPAAGKEPTSSEAWTSIESDNKASQHNTLMEVERLFSRIGSLIEEPVLKDIKRAFQKINDHTLSNFSDYYELNVFESALSNFIDELCMRISELKGKSGQSNPSIDEYMGCADKLQQIIKGRVLQIRLKFMEDLLVTPNLKGVLFGQLVATEENIIKRYKQLALLFHPDRTEKWLPVFYKSRGDELFKRIVACKEEVLKEFEKEAKSVGKFSFHQKQGDDLWTLAMDYKRAKRADWLGLKMLKKEDISHFSSTELEDQRIINLKNAYQEYRACCKISDLNKDIRNQIQFRGYMALCLHECKNESIAAQLYALSAMRLIMNNSQHVTQQDFLRAKQIFDKVKGVSNPMTLSEEEAKRVSTDKSSAVVISSQKDLSIPFARAYSYAEKQNIQNSIEQGLSDLANSLILNSDRSIVRYQASPEEILRSKREGNIRRVAGVAVGTAGVGLGGLVVAGTGLEILQGVGLIAGATLLGGPIVAIIAGVGTIGLGIWGGYNLIRKGNTILKEPKIRETLNAIMVDAIKAYDTGDYSQFIEVLSKEYKKSSRILVLKGPDDSINAKEIVKSLLEHGFRPDGIAYLLNLIGEALSSGKVKIPGISQRDLVAKSKEALYGALNEDLVKTAETLDNRIHELRLKNYKSRWNQFKDILSLQDHSSIAAEYVDDSQEMPFKARLEEMCNIAKMNIAIIRIVNGGEEEIELARNLIREVQESLNKSYQFIAKSRTRLEVLEDFLWVIGGQSVSEQEPAALKAITNSSESLSGQGLASEEYILYLDKELKTASSTHQKVNIYNKKASFYARKAQEESKGNHLKSLRDWKEAQKNYQAALGLDTKDIVAAMGFCKCLIKLSKYSEVLAFLSKNENLATISDYWLMGSIANRKKNDYKKAQRCIIEALKIDKDNQEADKELKLIKKLQESNSKNVIDLYKKNKPKCKKEYLNYRRSDKTPFYKILSIDGGGIRGIIPAVWLSEIERKTRRPISHLFNMLAGTSTGGIIAAGLSAPWLDVHYENRLEITPEGGYHVVRAEIETPSSFRPRYTATDILELYTEKAPHIFTTNSSWLPIPQFLRNTATTKYTAEGRLNIFKKKFGVTKISQTLTDLVIPAACEDDLTASHIFNHYDSSKDPSKNDTLVDVLMATSAAPTFFPSHRIPNKGIFSDGGVHLNNPSATAYHEALRYGIPKDKIFVLSMGTGGYIPDPLNPGLYRGQLFWAQNLHKVALSAQEGNTDVQMYHLLPKNRYQRWQAWLGEPITLDAYGTADIDNLIEIGRQQVEELYASDDNTMNKLLEFLESDVETAA
ncbi:MAG: patatin-like phospholipase family protein [Candidatus Amoebophilus sp.]